MSGLVVAYMFLGGTGAGGLVVVSLLGLALSKGSSKRGDDSLVLNASKPKRSYYAISYFVSLVFLALGGLCLFLDLGNPGNALALFTNPSRSLISIGGLSIALCLACGVVCAFLYESDKINSLILVRLFEIVCAISGSVVVVYIGFFLGLCFTVALWGYWFVPALFIVSALSCGICLLLLVEFGLECRIGPTRKVRQLLTVDATLLFIELAFAVGAAIQVAQSPGLVYDDAWQFWPVFILAGLLVPLFLDVFTYRTGRYQKLIQLVSPLLVLGGGVMLRVIIASAGTRVALIGLL